MASPWEAHLTALWYPRGDSDIRPKSPTLLGLLAFLRLIGLSQQVGPNWA